MFIAAAAFWYNYAKKQITSPTWHEVKYGLKLPPQIFLNLRTFRTSFSVKTLNIESTWFWNVHNNWRSSNHWNTEKKIQKLSGTTIMDTIFLLSSIRRSGIWKFPAIFLQIQINLHLCKKENNNQKKTVKFTTMAWAQVWTWPRAGCCFKTIRFYSLR